MKALASVLILIGFGGAHAYAACNYPKAPEKLPDGATATKQEMVDAMQLIRKYNADIKTYTDCLGQEIDTQQKAAKADASLTKEQREEMKRQSDMKVQKVNAAVDEAEAVTARFNEQVKTFNSKGKDKG